MSQTQYAEHCGVSQQAISKAVRAGKIPLVDGKIDQEIADQLWRAQRMTIVAPKPASDPQQPAAVKREVSAPPIHSPVAVEELPQPKLSFVTPAPGTALSEQAALAKARREKLEFEMETQRSEWLPQREVEEAWGQKIVAARMRLLLIPESFIDATVRSQVEKLICEALDDVEKSWHADHQETPAA